MRHPRVLWGLLAAVLLLALAFLLLRRPETPAQREPPPAAPTPAASKPPPREASVPRPDAPPPPPLRLLPATRAADARLAHGAFAGRVVSASTGEGVAGAELTFAPEGGGATSVRAGREGAFRFQPTQGGTWQLASVTAEGYLPFGPEWGQSPVRLTATPGERIEGLVVALSPEVSLRGRVVDEEGQPVAGARVQVLTGRGLEAALFPVPEAHVQSDAKGELLLRAPEDAQVEARHPGFAPVRATVTAAVVLERRLLLRLTRAAADAGVREAHLSLAGVVVDGEGAPVPGALVSVESAASAFPAVSGAGGTAQADAQGRFRVEGLEEGRWDVSAYQAGRAPAKARDVEAGRGDVRLVLEQGLLLEGVVVDAEGRPVPSFTLAVQQRQGPLRREGYLQTTVVDAQGRYRVAGLVPGSFVVQVAAAGHAPAELPLQVAEGTQGPLRADFRLTPGARLSGVVVDAETKQPLSRARLSVEGLGAQGALAVRFDALSDEQGAFLLEGLAEGEVSLSVAAEGHHSRILGGIQVRAGSPAFERVELRPTQEGEEPKLELMGIGAVLAAREDALVVGEVVPGGGAAEAGLAAGDGVVRIDGVAVVELGFPVAVQRIRGPENSRVVLGVRRAGQQEVVDVPVTRKRLSL